MRYVNIETGAVVDSPFKLSGENWVLKEDAKKEDTEVTEQEEEYIEEEIDLAEMTNRELEQFAKEHEIPLFADDKKNKKNLIQAISKAFEE